MVEKIWGKGEFEPGNYSP